MTKGLLALCTVILLSLWLGSCSEATDPDGGGVRVLILSNSQVGNEWIDSSYVKHMDNFVFHSMNIGDSIPTLDDFVGYDVILLYEDGLFENSNEVGDLLYYYVLAGGNLVIGTFYWQESHIAKYGSSADTWGFMELIVPIYGNSCDYVYDSLGQVSNHDLTNGVNSLRTFYRGGVDTLRNGATAVAWWSDGDVMIAYNRPQNEGTITAVTTAPHEGFYWDYRGYPDAPQGDFFRLWENALRWTAGRGDGYSKQDVNLEKTPAGSLQKTIQKTPAVQRPSGGQLIK